MIAPRKQRLAGRRTQRRCVKPGVGEPARLQPLGHRHLHRPAKRARSAEPDIIEQDHENVRRTLGRQQRLDRRKRRIGVLRVIRRQPHIRAAQESEGRSAKARTGPWSGCPLIGGGQEREEHPTPPVYAPWAACSSRKCRFRDHPANHSGPRLPAALPPWRCSGSRCGSLTCRSPRPGGRPGGSEGSSSARRGAIRL